MTRIILLAIIIMLLGGCAVAADFTAGDVTLTLDDNVNVSGLSVGGKALPVKRAPLVTLWASDTQKTATPSVKGGSLAEGLDLSLSNARANARLQLTSDKKALHFRCTVKGDEGADRGLILRFSFPVDATGWRWFDDMQTSSVITGDRVFENVKPLRAYADLPEWSDQPALRMGYSNRNFCTVIAETPQATAPAGLVLAVPVDKPCMFRTAYDGENKRLDIVYDFALSAGSRVPYTADFAFDLYSCDPQWGMRSALQRYYGMYPEQFKVHVPEQGQWMAFSRLSEIDNANEFGFGLQEGAPEPQYDDKINVLSASYYTHAGMGANLPKPYDPEKDPLPPYEEQVKAVDKAFENTMKQAGIYEQVGTRKPDGKLAVEKWKVYAHLIAQFNLDPELPWGKFLVERTTGYTQSMKERTGGDLDGFYYDGLTSGLNYNPAHFTTADAPLLWDPVHKQAFLNNFFSSIEFARATAEYLRPRGQITMMNGGMGESFYVVPWLDILGAETGLIIPRADFNFVRASLHHKPFMTLLKGNYEQKLGRPQIELFMKRCLAYGVYPGFFDWPPSGLGPGGRYWDHPRYYERDRDLHAKYVPLCKSLALAGWEPVTHATSSEPNVFVERFGPDKQGVVWLTLLNEQQQPYPVTLTVDAKALGLDPANLRITEITSGQTLAPKAQGASLALSLQVPPEGVMVVQLGSPSAVAAWHLAQSAETVRRGAVQREVDEGKPPLLVHWLASGKGHERGMEGDQPHVVFHADGKSSMGMKQWVMLFQNAPQPVKVKLRLAGDNFDDSGNDAKLRCRIAWVTPSYSHYEIQDHKLPTGTYGWRDVEFTVDAPEALRAIELTPVLIGPRASGDLKLAEVSVTDASGQQYAVDGQLREWYEPFPQALREPVETKVAALQTQLGQLEPRAADLTTNGFRSELGKLFAVAREVEQAIAQAKAENGARRVLRDLETVNTHLSHIALASYKMQAPAVSGPATAAPGDTVALRFEAPKSGAGMPPTRAELQSDLKVIRQTGGGAVIIPADAQPGDSFLVHGLLHVGRPGEEATLRSAHTISVLAPLELSLQSEGFDATSGAARLGIAVRNNRTRALTGEVTVSVPAGWSAGSARSLRLPASQESGTVVTLTPAGKPVAGPVEIAARVTAGQDSAQARLVLLYIPPEANLLKNPGFEEGLKPWATETDAIALDTQVFRSSKQSLRLTNPTRRDTQASQSITLNQKSPTPVLIQASSRGQDVEGQPDRGYCLYVDIYYTDGTPWYGNIHAFQTGTTDWQLGELYLEPEKPIRNVNVYLLLRNKRGTVWFDDVAVMEDPLRKGNIAREAQVTVDSSYSSYDPGPINDGIIIGEGLHWTKEAWASGESESEHFIQLKFPAPVTVNRAMIYWSLDAGVPRSAQELHLQAFMGGDWQTLKIVRSLQATPQTQITLDQPVTADSFRLIQPPGKGPAGRGNLMWVREVELFPQ